MTAPRPTPTPAERARVMRSTPGQPRTLTGRVRDAAGPTRDVRDRVRGGGGATVRTTTRGRHYAETLKPAGVGVAPLGTYRLTHAPTSPPHWPHVTVNGLVQEVGSYSISGRFLTITGLDPSLTTADTLEVRYDYDTGLPASTATPAWATGRSQGQTGSLTTIPPPDGMEAGDLQIVTTTRPLASLDITSLGWVQVATTDRTHVWAKIFTGGTEAGIPWDTTTQKTLCWGAWRGAGLAQTVAKAHSALSVDSLTPVVPGVDSGDLLVAAVGADWGLVSASHNVTGFTTRLSPSNQEPSYLGDRLLVAGDITSGSSGQWTVSGPGADIRGCVMLHLVGT